MDTPNRRKPPASLAESGSSQKGAPRRSQTSLRATGSKSAPSDIPAPLTLPLPRQGAGGGGGRGLPASVHPLKTSGNEPVTSGVHKDKFAAEWNLWAAERAGHHDYREIYCTRCGEDKSVPIYCKMRFCPVCSKGRRMKVIERLRWMINHTPHGKIRTLKMVTLTQENSRDPVAGAHKIISAFKRLRQTKLWKVASCNGAYVIEVTGEPGRWHVHIHAIMISAYIKQERLSAEWKMLTGCPVVHIECVEPDRGVYYVTKYISKGDFDPKYIDQVAAALKSVRLFNAFGSWHNMKAPKIKLVCDCPVCHGSRWALKDLALPGESRYFSAYQAQLRQEWLNSLAGLGTSPPQ
jgi:hypothetical protein